MFITISPMTMGLLAVITALVRITVRKVISFVTPSLHMMITAYKLTIKTDDDGDDNLPQSHMFSITMVVALKILILIAVVCLVHRRLKNFVSERSMHEHLHLDLLRFTPVPSVNIDIFYRYYVCFCKLYFNIFIFK